MLTDWPAPDRSPSPPSWSWPAALLPATGERGWPRGRRPVTEAEDILADAIAWWDVDRSGFRDGDRWLRNLGSGGSALDLRLGSSLAANSNDPRWLGVEDRGYVYLPGVASNRLTVPDEAALDITGDIDLRALVALDDWTPAAEQGIVAKFNSDTSQVSYRLAARTNGQLRFYWSVNGSTQLNQSSTAEVPASDGSPLWVRVTLDVDNGASGHAVTFYTSQDGSTWTQLGNVITGVGTTSIFSGSQPVEIGAVNSGTATSMSGRVYRAQVLNGIDGSTVLDVDCDALTSGSATSFTATTGQTVTINRSTSGRKSVAVPSRSRGGRPLMLLGTDDWLGMSGEATRAPVNLQPGASLTALLVYRQWATPSTSMFLMGNRRSTALQGGWMLRNNSTTLQCQAVISDASGANSLTVSPTGTYTAGTLVGAAFTIDRATHTATLRSTATTGTASTRDLYSGDLTAYTSAGFQIGLAPNTASYGDFELYAAAIWRRALTSREITTITTNAPWGT